MEFANARYADADHTIVVADVGSQVRSFAADDENPDWRYCVEHEVAIAAFVPHVDLAAYAADKRRALANGAATVDLGTRAISTWVDPESRGAATGLVVASTIVPELTAPWKGADGEFYTLDAVEITALAMGMMEFVQACFACEASVLAEISGGTITTTAAIDAAPWPA